MKKLATLLISAIVSLLSLTSIADITNPSERQKIVINRKTSNRPKAPSKQEPQEITCLYANTGEIDITFRYSEGECILNVFNYENNEEKSYVFDSNNTAIIFVGELSNAQFEIITEAGYTYVGTLTIN